MERPNISPTSFRTAFVLILVLAVSLLFLAVAWPFLKPLLLGAMLAGLCTPLYDWIARLVRGRGSLAAILTLLILFLLVAGPISAFVGIVVAQALNVSDQAIPWVQQHFGSGSTFNAHDWLVARFPALAPYVPDQAQILETAGPDRESRRRVPRGERDGVHRRDGRRSPQSLRHALRDVFLLPRRQTDRQKDFLLHAAESRR